MSLAVDLKQRKVVQRGIAYAAAAFALLQGVDSAAGTTRSPAAVALDWPL